jgi:lysozyme
MTRKHNSSKAPENPIEKEKADRHIVSSVILYAFMLLVWAILLYIVGKESQEQVVIPEISPSIISVTPYKCPTTMCQIVPTNTPIYARQTSGAGKILILRFEGFSQTPEQDGAGYCAIGYGHTLHQGNCNNHETIDFITDTQARTMFNDDLKVSEFAVFQGITVPLLQNQYDAVVSIVYNMGWPNFVKTEIPDMINSFQFDRVAAEIRKNNCCLLGIQNRREDEATLFETGKYPGVDK